MIFPNYAACYAVYKNKCMLFTNECPYYLKNDVRYGKTVNVNLYDFKRFLK